MPEIDLPAPLYARGVGVFLHPWVSPYHATHLFEIVDYVWDSNHRSFKEHGVFFLTPAWLYTVRCVEWACRDLREENPYAYEVSTSPLASQQARLPIYIGVYRGHIARVNVSEPVIRERATWPLPRTGRRIHLD